MGIDLGAAGWWGGRVAGSVTFVGREGELSRLWGALGGDTRLVLVAGDAGIGKSRLAAEGMRLAAAEQIPSVRGACLPLADKLSLLPVAEALGELAGLDRGSLVESALSMAPAYVRAEVGRLVPRLAPGEPASGQRGEGWRRDRLFTAVAELLGAVARRGGLVVVIEDVHWADRETLDLLTFLVRAGRDSGLRVVATCRTDEVPRDAHVIEWLAHVRGGGGVEEIRLGPLSRQETAEQIASVTGAPAPGRFVDDLFARAEGNPFFTEQLVAAALLSPGGFAARSGLPAGLAEALAVRASRCGGDARAVLAALAVAGRPLTEELLGAVTGLSLEGVRGGLRELATARLLADTPADGAHRPRHALLAEAVAGGLLPGERAGLHARTAQALAAAGDPALAAEIAGHWAAAGRPAEELPARVAAAEAAERVFGYAEAAAHWQRAIELCAAPPGTAAAAGIDVPRLYVRAIDALELSGDGVSAGRVAEEAYHRFADHPGPQTAAVICHRAGVWRQIEARAAALPLIEAALRLFQQAPPSAEYAEALFDYALFLPSTGEDRQASRAALTRALEIAEQLGATALIPRILAGLGHNAFVRGQVEEGLAIFQRGWALAEASADGVAQVLLGAHESDALLKLAKFPSAAEVAVRGLEAAWHAGLEAWFVATIVAANASEALVALGRTAEAGALIDPLTTGPPDRGNHILHDLRAEIDLLRGDLTAAGERRQLLEVILTQIGDGQYALEHGRRAAELALWAGRPGDALNEVRRALLQLNTPYLVAVCGRLLTAGLWACADLAERARARRDEPAAETTTAAVGDLAGWVDQVGGAPFTDHPFVATIAAERATWDAEQTRLAGASDPAAWAAAAKTWQDLGCPHRAGYAWWRHAEARLAAGHPPAEATAALRAAAAAAGGHAPLVAEIGKLAERARIPLQAPPAASPGTPPPATAPYGLTGRELAVLRLVAAGRSNAQIGAELYMSPRTAGVHVTNILRKLGVTGRVQAAALAERAGLLEDPQP